MKKSDKVHRISNWTNSVSHSYSEKRSVVFLSSDVVDGTIFAAGQNLSPQPYIISTKDRWAGLPGRREICGSVRQIAGRCLLAWQSLWR